MNKIKQFLLSHYLRMQGPRRDSGNTGAKKCLDALENDTKPNLQENIPGKVPFQTKTRGEHLSPLASGGPREIQDQTPLVPRSKKCCCYFSVFFVCVCTSVSRRSEIKHFSTLFSLCLVQLSGYIGKIINKFSINRI